MSEGSLIYRAKPAVPPRGMVEAGFFVQVEAPFAFEEEDVHPEIWARGYRYEVFYAIEGDTIAGWDAFEPEIERALDEGAALVVDDTLSTREAGEEVLPPQDKPKTKIASLSLYFEGGPRFEAEGFDRLLDLMQSILPEALPRRYGSPYERPQFALAKQGLEHFKVEWRRNARLVWMPTAPISNVYMSIRNDARDPKSTETRGRPWMGYYCSRIELLIEADLTQDAALTARLERFLREASVITRAFYADLRAEQTDGPGWWWKGLPPGAALCFVLGEPYRTLWREAAGNGEPLGRCQIWVSCEAQKHAKLRAPPRLACPPQNATAKRPDQQWRYARRFPFARHDEPLLWWWHALQQRRRDAAY